MGEFFKFPEIVTLDRCPQVFQVNGVVVTEKIHGTNARFGVVDGQFKVGGRNQEFASPRDDHYGFFQWLLDHQIEDTFRAHLATDQDVIVYGEWYGPRVQKGITYSTVRQFRGFAVRVGRAFLPVKEALAFIESLGLATVPVLYEGVPNQQVFDLFKSMFSRTALLNAEDGQDLGVNLWENTAEGIVIWPAYPFQDRYGDWVIAKHKDTKWSERRVSDATNYTIPTSAQTFVDSYGTPQRLEHVLQHLFETGVDVQNPKSIGAILREFSEDMIREGAGEYATLSTDEQKAVKKVSARVGKQLLDIADLSVYTFSINVPAGATRRTTTRRLVFTTQIAPSLEGDGAICMEVLTCR